jgi:cytochrome c oxidase subunit IV
MNASPHDDHTHAHGGSLRTTYAVFGGLLGLLVATVGVAYLDLGALGLPVAMGIAVAKAGLILAYFMHLVHESPLVRVFAASGFVSLLILFAITLADFAARTADSPASVPARVTTTRSAPGNGPGRASRPVPFRAA